MNKVKVYHFHNGSGGGVLSVIRNLLRYSQNDLIENHVIYTINKDQVKHFTIPNLPGAKTEQIFYYSSRWNYYYTFRRLSKQLPDEKALIIAHDWLELGMVSNLGLQNPVMMFLHGDYEYYYQLAMKHVEVVNVFVGIAESIQKKAVQLLPEKKDEIFYFRFPVPGVGRKINTPCDFFNVVFVGRLTVDKGYNLLPLIAEQLNFFCKKVKWHIIGEKSADTRIQWGNNIDVCHYGLLSNDAVFRVLEKMDVVVLPSLAEGMPVILIEAMKAGVIPLVNNLSGGIQELVEDGKTGFKIVGNGVDQYVEKLLQMLSRPELLTKMSANCIEIANCWFDPYKNTQEIENMIAEIADSKMKKWAKRVYGSRLDQPWIPNLVTATLRK